MGEFDLLKDVKVLKYLLKNEHLVSNHYSIPEGETPSRPPYHDEYVCLFVCLFVCIFVCLFNLFFPGGKPPDPLIMMG